MGFVAPLDRLEVRQISDRFLGQDERIRIADLRQEGVSIRQIGRQLGRAASTISRELRRNGVSGDYGPFQAHRRAMLRRARPRLSRLEANSRLHKVVAGLLDQRWSPGQISRRLHHDFPDDPGMQLCHETIYRAIYRPGSPLIRPTRLAPPGRLSPLRTGRTGRRAHQHGDRRRPRFQEPMLTIAERGFAPEDRSQAGHWEGDLIIGTGQQSAIGTLVERRTRTLRLLHLVARDGEALHQAIVERMGDLPEGLMRSITWDQGTEMARHLDITVSLGAPVYFADAHSPWQRGSNENTNGLLRDYFPKGTDLSVYSPEHLQAVEDELNHRPRAVLDDHCPADLFNALLASQNPSVLRR